MSLTVQNVYWTADRTVAVWLSNDEVVLLPPNDALTFALLMIRSIPWAFDEYPLGKPASGTRADGEDAA